jgi:hypothetical protein
MFARQSCNLQLFSGHKDRKISLSLDWFDDMEPLGTTKPAIPVGRKM